MAAKENPELEELREKARELEGRILQLERAAPAAIAEIVPRIAERPVAHKGRIIQAGEPII